MEKEILFSILVPVYNTESFIRECVDSVIRQTYRNWELILVDDGSTDQSGEICEQIAISNDKIKAYHKMNSGQSETRCFAAQQAHGDYYIFLDSDDKLFPDALMIIEREVRNNSFPDCIIYGLKKENLMSGQIEIWTEKETAIYTSYPELLKKILSDPTYNSLCRKAIKASLMTFNRYSLAHRIINGEDLIQSIELLQNSQMTIFIPEILYWYRDNEHSVTHRIDLAQYTEQYLETKKYILDKFVVCNTLSENELEQLSNRFLIPLIDIIRINSQCMDVEKRNNIYDLIRNHDVYNSFIIKYRHGIRDLGTKALFFHLFRHRFYNTITLVEKCWRSLKSLLQRKCFYK